MGWFYLDRAPGQSDLAFFRQELDAADRLIDGATVADTFYGAYRCDDGSVIALVAALDRRPGQLRFGYKPMDEGMGPYATRCPGRILDLLTEPAPNAWAAAWRARC